MEPPSSSLVIEFLYLGISLILLLVCSALISGSEVAYFSLSPKQLNNIKNSKDKDSERVLKLLSQPDYLLRTILQTNNLVNILIILLSSVVIGKAFCFNGNVILEFLVSVVSLTFLLALFGEVLPKIIASHTPVSFAKFMSAPLLLLSPITRPFNFIMNTFASKVTNGILSRDIVTLEELEKAVDISSTESVEEKKILKGIVKLPITDVRKIMKPRVSVAAIDIKMKTQDIIKIASECGYSRLPVYKDDLDDIKGFLYIKDILMYLNQIKTAYSKELDFVWHKHIRDAYFVPESKKINDLLQEFRDKKIHLAVVVDEYGGTEGVVTLEDILEEIVGEIVDETDIKELMQINK